MARMIPDLPVDELDPENLRYFNGDVSERAVYRALKEQLPPTWVVRYDYAFCYHQAGKRCPDGQADFIVIVPHRGLMFLEVKGAAGMAIVDGQCFWQLDDGRLGNATTNPFNQAQANKHNVVAILKNSVFNRAGFPGCYGHIVVFPRARGKLPASQDTDIVVCHDGMSDLKNRVIGAFAKFGDEARASEFDTQEMSRVVQFFEDNANFIPVAAADVEEDERLIHALTRQQWQAFKGILGNSRVLVQGVAGSGKTLLALWAAEQFVGGAGKVLFLCFNKLLKEWIDGQYPAKKRGFDVETFHSLAARRCRDAGLHLEVFGAQDWQNRAPNLLLEAIEKLEEAAQYDVVIVDEAQDFHPPWFTPVEFMLRKGESRLLVFSDPRQKLFAVDGVELLNMARYELSENCRNTRNISGFCGKVVQFPIPSFSMAPEGVTPQILPAETTVSARWKRTRDVVSAWLHEGIKPSQITILSPWADANPACCLAGKTSVAGNTLLRGESGGISTWKRGGCILIETIKAFKGLEADCLVITDVPEVGAPGFEIADLYVAASRAKHRLVFLPASVNAQSQLAGFANF
jgi:hypothetical protein